jgi:hypothetical protein
MPGTFTYRRLRSVPPEYLVHIELELSPSQHPIVHVTRYREHNYSCGGCGHQTPIYCRRNERQTQGISGIRVQELWAYEFGDMRPDDVVRIELHEAGTQTQIFHYTATRVGFTVASSQSRGWPDEDVQQTTLIDAGNPVDRVQTGHRGQNWWQRKEGMLRVRNGFSVQGLIATPVPRIDTTARSLSQALTSKKQEVKEPVCLN